MENLSKMQEKRLEAAKKLNLNEKVAKNFKLVGLAGAGKVLTNKLDGKLREVDLAKISVNDAEALVQNKFPYLEKIQKSATPEKSESKGSDKDKK